MFSSKSNELKLFFYLIIIILICEAFAKTETLKPSIDKKGVVPLFLLTEEFGYKCLNNPDPKIGPVRDLNCKIEIYRFRAYWDRQPDSDYCLVQAVRDNQIVFTEITGVEDSGRVIRDARLNGLHGNVKFYISKIVGNRCGPRTEVTCPQPDYSKPQTIAAEELNTINRGLNKIKQSSVFNPTKGTTTTTIYYPQLLTTTTQHGLVINDKEIMFTEGTKIIPIDRLSTAKENNFPKAVIIIITFAIIITLFGSVIPKLNGRYGEHENLNLNSLESALKRLTPA